MKKNNTQAIVLRAGLALSMLVGIGFHTDSVSAAEQEDISIQEKSSFEETSENEASQEELLEADEEQKSVEEAEVEEVSVEETESDMEEETEDTENLHKNELAIDEEEAESPEKVEDEIQPEEISTDTEEEVAEEDETSESEEELVDDDTAETEANEEEAAAEGESDEEESLDAKETPEAKTMQATNDSSANTINVDRIYGENRYLNAVEISKKGWSTAPKVFLANGRKFADSLTGTPLAAMNDAPILLTRENSLPDETLTELRRLNTNEVVILGGEASVSNNITNTLIQNGFTVTRIGGSNRYTQAELVANEIMKAEGKNRDAFLASGEVFSDALSIATVASNKRLPIFLTRGHRLHQSVLNAIPDVNSWTIIGGEATIDRSVEDEMKDAGAKVKRIAGKNRYAVNRNVHNHYGTPEDHMYVTSGEHYSDTLPASVLAAKEKSGVLLVRNNNEKRNAEQKFFAQNQHDIRNFTFVGGPATLSEETKDDFEELIRTVDNEMIEFIAKQFSHYRLSEYDIRLDDALNMQMKINATPQTDKRYSAFVSKDFIDSKTNKVTADLLNVRSGAGVNNHVIAQLRKGDKVNILKETDNWYQIDLRQYWLNASPEDVRYYLNPNNFVTTERQMFQFLDLTRTAGATAEQLNTYLKGKGILEGTGQAFIEASKKHGINEIYLLSHALLETGHGTSKLATGVQVNGDVVFNVFGIGAYDSDPVKFGSLKAQEKEWFSPEEAIIGGAAFIGNNYVKDGQNTLYKMRWNPDAMANYGYATHQYATDIGWASKQVHTIYNLYNSIGVGLNYVDIPVYIA